MTRDLDTLLDWLRKAVAEPIQAESVPGASEAERQRLTALGGLVRDLVPSSGWASWPTDVIDWLESGPSAPHEVVSAAKRSVAHEPDEVLATIYGQLVSSSSRRSLGTFFTPTEDVTLMLDMWKRTEEVPSTVVDVGAGVGVFTATAATCWPGAHVYGVDINPVTLGLLALRISLSDLPFADSPGSPSGIHLIRDDFTAWLEKSWTQTSSPKLILGNPPYTRWQLLSPRDRKRLSKAANGLCGSRASLSTLMTAISLHYLGTSDGLCFLLPAQWLESQYAIPLRNHLAGLTRRRIEVRLVESPLFPDAQVDAVVLLIGSEKPTKQEFLIAGWKNSEIISVNRDKLINREWRSLFSSDSHPAAISTAIRDDSPGAKLSEFCTVRRGTATGANAFFVMTDDRAAEHNIPSNCLIQLIRRLNHYPDIIDSDAFHLTYGKEERWLLHAKADDRRSNGAIDLYLKHGEATGISERYLCKDRKSDWHDLTHDIFIPDIIISPMTRGQVRIAENKVGAVITNNLYGWRWLPEIPANTRAAIVNWLRSTDGQTAILAAARRQGDGLRKIEPKALTEVIIPGSVARTPQTLL